MKKVVLFTVSALTLILLAGCSKTKESAPASSVTPSVEEIKPVQHKFKFDDSLEPIVVGHWNEDNSVYIMDLSKVTCPGGDDSKIVINEDGTIDVTFLTSYSQILIPMPVTDHEFMEQVTNCSVTVTSDVDDLKKIVWKMSKSTISSWGNSGGVSGQGENCVAYQFRDYEDIWESTDLTQYYNNDDFSFPPLMELPEIRALAMCNNTTKAPFTFRIESIYWCK